MSKFQLEEQVKTLEQQLHRQATLYQNARTESEEFQSMVKDFSMQMMDFQKESEGLKVELRTEQAQAEELRGKLADAELRAQEADALLENERQRSRRFEFARTALEDEIAELRSRVEGAGTLDAAQVEEMRAQIGFLNNKVEEHANALENEKRQNDVRVKELENALNQSRKEVMEAMQALETEKENSVAVRSRLEMVEHEFEESVATFAKERMSLEETLHGLREQLQASSVRADTAHLEGDSVAQELMDQLRDAKMREEEAISALKKAHGELENEKLDKAKLSEELSKVDQLRRQAVTANKKDLEFSSSQSDKKIEAAAADYESKLADYRSQLTDLSKKLDETSAVLEEERELARNKEVAFDLKLALTGKESEEKLLSAEKRIAELKTLMETGKEEGEKLVKKLVDKMNAAKKKAEENARLLANKILEMKESDELAAKLEASQKKYRRLEKQLAADVGTWETRYEELRVKLEAAEKDLQKEKGQSQTQMSEMKTKLEGIERKANKTPVPLVLGKSAVELPGGETKLKMSTSAQKKAGSEMRKSAEMVSGGGGEREVTRRGLRGGDFAVGVDGILSCADDRLQAKLEEARRRAESSEASIPLTPHGSWRRGGESSETSIPSTPSWRRGGESSEASIPSTPRGLSPLDKGADSKETKEGDDAERGNAIEQQAAIAEARSKLAAAEKLVAKLMEEKAKMGKEVNDLTSKLDDAEKGVSEMKSRLELAESWMVKDSQGNLLVPKDVERKLVMELKTRLIEAEKRVEEMARLLSNTKASSARKVEEMKSALDGAEKRVREGNEAKEITAMQVTELRGKLELVQKQLKETMADRDVCIKKLEDTKEKLEASGKELDVARKRLDELELMQVQQEEEAERNAVLNKSDGLEKNGDVAAEKHRAHASDKELRSSVEKSLDIPKKASWNQDGGCHLSFGEGEGDKGVTDLPNGTENSACSEEDAKAVVLGALVAASASSYRDAEWEIQELKIRLQEVERLAEVRVAGLLAERDASFSQVTALTSRVKEMMRSMDALGITAEQLKQVGEKHAGEKHFVEKVVGEKPLVERSDSVNSRSRRRSSMRDGRRKRVHSHSRSRHLPRPKHGVAAVIFSLTVAALAIGSKVVSRR